MPTLRQLQYLTAVADLLSFSRAAERLNVTQPTLSVQIADVEARLGVTVFERSRARVIVTPRGAGVIERARRVLAASDDLISFARAGADPQTAVLRLGVVPSVGAYLLSVAMPEIRAAFPHLRLQLREDGSQGLLQQLSQGAHEALVLPFRPSRDEFHHEVLLREEFQLVLPAGHPLSALPRVPAEALSGLDVLTMSPGEQVFEEIAGLCLRAGARLARNFEGTSLDTLRQMVATGMGVALLPALYIRSEVLREKLVVSRPLEGPAPSRDIVMLWRRRQEGEARLTALAGVMRGAVRAFDSRTAP